MKMVKDLKNLSRREFLELAAIGTAGVAVTGLGVPSAFAAKPKRGGTLNVGVGFLIQTPDPQRYGGGWARTHMAFLYEGLTTPTSRGERLRTIKEKGVEALSDVQPMLADSWEIEKGGQRYVFHLKKGVKFHNGKELDSGDVEWSWKRIQDPIHLAHARKLLTTFLKSIETPDRYTVVANMDRPYGGFLMANAWPYTPILPKDCMPHGVIWGLTASFKMPTPGPPGTGPFKLVEFQQKAQAVLEAHREYRIPALPYLDMVILKVISKPVPHTMAVRAGDIDVGTIIDEKWLTKVMKGRELYKVEELKKEGLKLFAGSGAMNPYTIYLNSHPERGDSPFRHEKVRQAMDCAIDRAQIVKVLYGKLGYPRGQGFDPNVSPWGFEDIGYTEQDIPKAKRLLKEAGYPNGLDVNFSITPTWGKQDLLAQIVQQMARPAGFRIKIIPEKGVQYWSRLRRYDYHMLHYHMGKEDPMSYYYPWMHTDPAEPWNGHTPCGFIDPEMDKMLEAVAAESNFVKRKKLLKKVVIRAREKAYILPYVSPVGATVWNKRVKNVKPLEYFHTMQGMAEVWLDV
jgi:peptide/nickel transport system substrate-binding protein